MTVRALVAVSGGLDSAVLAHWAVDRYGVDNVALAYVDFGMINANKAELSVRRLKDTLAVRFYPIRARLPDDVADKFYLFNKQLYDIERARRSGGALYMAEDLDRFVDAYVPGLYTLVWNMIGALAAAEFYDLVLVGNHKQPPDLVDRVVCGIMDTSTAFLNCLNDMRDVIWGPNAPLIETPFDGILKDEVAAMGVAMGVDIASTNSCNLYPPCGVCFECQLRACALKK